MSAYFDGTTSYSYKTGLLPSTAVPLTISCWINPTTQTAAANRGLVRLGLPAATATNRDTVRLFLNNTGTLAAQAADSAGANASTTTALVQAGVWNHCLGVFPASNSRTAYLNATAATTNTNNRVITIGATQLAIGASLYNSGSTVDNFFDGEIAHVAIWDEALSTREIVALSQGEDPRFIRPNALRYYNALVTPVHAPAEAIVNRSWTSWNQVIHPYLNGEDPGSQVFVNIARSNDNPYISSRRPTAKIYQFAPQGTSVTVSVTGESLATTLESVTAAYDANVAVTGESATTTLNSVTPVIDTTVALTGEALATTLDSVSVVIGLTVAVTGEEAATTLGSVTAAYDFATAVTGESATTTLGSVTAAYDFTAAVTGEALTTALGDVQATQNADALITGEALTTSLGSVTAISDATVAITGLSSTMTLGSVTLALDIVVDLTALSAATELGDVATRSDSTVALTGEALTTALGSVATVVDVEYLLTGFFLGTNLSNVTVQTSVSSLLAQTYLGFVTVWGVIDDGQTPNWTPVIDTQGPSWGPIIDAQSPNWIEIE